MEMDLERRAQLRPNEKNNLTSDGIQFYEFYKMSGRPGDPGQFTRLDVTGKRFANGLRGLNVFHD
jgi:hypothetical protein